MIKRYLSFIKKKQKKNKKKNKTKNNKKIIKKNKMSFFGLTSLGPESLIKATLVNAGCKKKNI